MVRLLPILLLLACHAAAGQDAVPRPELRPGDSWTYRRMDLLAGKPAGRPNFTVTFANDKAIGGIVHRQGQRVDATFTSDWNVVNDPTSGVFLPHNGLLRFPLAQGASWRTQFEVVRPLRGTFRSAVDLAVRVAGWEEVAVPAGRFRALKVEAEGTFQRTDKAGAGHMRFVLWYAPAVKRWVKRTFESGNRRGHPLANEVDELVSHRLN